MISSPSVSGSLERAREVTEPLARDAVGRLSPNIRDVVAYHMGWKDAQGKPTAGNGGKGIRQALAVLSAEAAWADASVGAPGGVAVELVHNFSLVHDDLMDGDLERRHRPTVWALWGPSVALIAGDALATLAVDVVLRSSSAGAPAAALALTQATAEMIAGQADDLAFEGRRTVSVEECMTMSTAKTGALLGCAASIGAILACAPAATVEAMKDFGRHLGVAFQAVDDLLGIWGDPASTGKPAGNDLQRRKKSMPIVAALAAGDDCSKELGELLFADTWPASGGGSGGPADGPEWAPSVPKALSEEEVARAASLVESCGGRAWTAARAKAHFDAALGSLERARLSPVPRSALADLAKFVVEREA